MQTEINSLPTAPSIEPPFGPFESIEEKRVFGLAPLCEKLKAIACDRIESDPDALSSQSDIDDIIRQMASVSAESAGLISQRKPTTTKSEPAPVAPTSAQAVTVRAVLERINRRLSPYGRVSVARSYGDKQYGRFLLLESNVIKDGFTTVEQLADYARQIGALAAGEFITIKM